MHGLLHGVRRGGVTGGEPFFNSAIRWGCAQPLRQEGPHASGEAAPRSTYSSVIR